MKILFHNPSQIISVNSNGKNFKRGSELKEIGLLENCSIVSEDGSILEIVPTSETDKSDFEQIVDLSNKILLPGLVECHTHSVFSGSRADEFIMKMEGAGYEEIAESGGGINSTVRSVRKCSFEELLELAEPRVQRFIEQGVTVLEIKSGYGLSFYDEIKMLEVIQKLNDRFAIDIIPTFLGAHTFPPEYINDKNKYVDLIVNEMIPFIADKKLAEACDGFCEATAFSPDQINQVFESAIKHGLPVKLHTDQFHPLGGFDLALKNNALSVDHLEVLPQTENYKLGNTETAAVLLPGVSFSLRYRYADARDLINKNSIIALATDFNPGSSHINNISFIWGLAAFFMDLKIEEIISAYTINSAKALGISDKVGSIEIGKSADFSVYDVDDYRELLYNFSNNLNVMTIKQGKVIYER